MRKRSEIESKRTSSIKVALAGLLIIAVLLPGILPASETKAGNVLVLKMKDGRAGKGELLAVNGDRLILLDSEAQTDSDIPIGDIARIRVIKKSKFLAGLGTGLLIGAAGGGVVGLMSGDNQMGWFSYIGSGQQAITFGSAFGLLGALIGGGIGAGAGNDEWMETGSASPQELDQVLNKLKKFARITD